VIALTARAPRDSLFSNEEPASSLPRVPAFFGRILLFVILLLSVCSGDLYAASDAGLTPGSYGYFDFPTCLRYALVHSQRFLDNRIEIQVRSEELKNAHAELLPTLELWTRYYLNRTRTGDDTSKYGRFNIYMYMTNFNPLGALVKAKSYSIMVDVAKLSHMDKIGEDVNAVAKLFFAVDLLEKSIRASNEILALQRNKLNQAKARQEQGTVDDLQIRTWSNMLRSQQIKVRSLKQERDSKIQKIKILIGYHPDFHVPLDTRDAVNQILAGFNGQSVTFAEVQSNNWSLQVLAKREQLQSQYVTGQYVMLLPRPALLFENVQNQVDRTSGMNIALGLDYTIWDGFRRMRDIKKYKLQAQQAKIKRDQFSMKLYETFKEIRAILDLASESEGFSREQAKLAELTEEKAFLEYQAGKLTYDLYMDKRIEKVQAQLDALNSIKDRVIALIDLATMAGGLNKYNAGIRY